MYVADIACGPGTPLSTEQGATVVAVDFSGKTLGTLSRNTRNNSVTGVSLHRADRQHLPFPNNTFDLLCSLSGLMFFQERARVYAETVRILRPDGWAYVLSLSKQSDAPLLHGDD